jgi:2-hydroxychromene-2-carboxylate isomerase
MTRSVDFIFDFASPNGYLAHRVLPPILQRTGATVKIIPCLLGGIFKATGNQAPMIAFAPVKGKLEYERLEFMRFIERHRLAKFRFNRHFPVNTLLLMRGFIAAQKLDVAGAYLEFGLAGMWEQSLKLDDPAVFAKALKDAGLDAEAIVARAQEADVKQELVANTEAAVKRGAFGVPTFYIGEEMFFGKDRLGQVEDELRAQAA